jgi:hypothetical protein
MDIAVNRFKQALLDKKPRIGLSVGLESASPIPWIRRSLLLDQSAPGNSRDVQCAHEDKQLQDLPACC